MSKLAWDVCRCFGLDNGGQWICPERTGCVRFLCTLEPEDGERVPYAMSLNSSKEKPCEMRIPKEG